MRLLLLSILGVVLIAYATQQYLRTRHYIQIGEGLAAHAIPFSQSPIHPALQILVIGDSTAVGTGASASSTSLAGLLGKRYPQAEIVNKGVNGAKIEDLLRQLSTVVDSYDLIMLHIGGNDTVRFTPYDQVQAGIRNVLDIAVKHGKHVVLTCTGNVGTVGLFPAPTRWIFENRTRRVRDILKAQVASTVGDVHYVDLFRERAQDPFALDPTKYYAADLFHPNDEGYKDWFTLMAKQLDQVRLE